MLPLFTIVPLATPPEYTYSYPPLATLPIAIPPLEINSVSPEFITTPDEVAPEEIIVVVIYGLRST
jgi:hypothetical protein